MEEEEVFHKWHVEEVAQCFQVRLDLDYLQLHQDHLFLNNPQRSKRKRNQKRNPLKKKYHKSAKTLKLKKRPLKSLQLDFLQKTDLCKWFLRLQIHQLKRSPSLLRESHLQ